MDFDNIYINLRELDPVAAEGFATNPNLWVDWLEQGRETREGKQRRFLVKKAYLNPGLSRQARAVYTRAGFRVVDCPPLTSRGKNSADIYMVLDICDALEHAHFEDFVIMSADADFTPVLHRIRAADRRTTVVTASATAPAYRAVCDVFVAPERLAAAASGREDPDLVLAGMDGDVAPELEVLPTEVARSVAAERAEQSNPGELQHIRDRMLAVVQSSDLPLVSAAVAQAGLDVQPRLKELDWLGAGSFRAFLALYLEELEYVSLPSPGYVLDPRRHSRGDVPKAAHNGLPSLLERVCFVTGAPTLSSAAYSVLFRELAKELADHPYHVSRTPKGVRDRTAVAGAPVSRAAVTFVVQGLLYSGARLTGEATAQELAGAWLNQLGTLLGNAQMDLTEEQEVEVREWILGTSSE